MNLAFCSFIVATIFTQRRSSQGRRFGFPDGYAAELLSSKLLHFYFKPPQFAKPSHGIKPQRGCGRPDGNVLRPEDRIPTSQNREPTLMSVRPIVV
jgi:hypothetical protein